MSLIVNLLFLIISRLIIKNRYNPIYLFNIWWLLTVLMSTFGYKNIITPTDRIYIIFIIGSISFNIIALIAYIFLQKKTTKVFIEINESISYKSYQIFKICQIILFIYFSVKAIMLLKMLMSGYDYSTIRAYYFSDQYLSSTLEYLILKNIINPLMIATQIIFSINIFIPKFKTPTILLIVANILLRAFVSGGRMSLVELSITILVCFLIFKKMNMSSNYKKKVFSLLSVAIIGSVIISKGRGGSGSFINQVVEKIIVYFSGSFTYLDILIENNSIPFGSLYGRATFGGILDLFISLFRYIGITSIDTASYIIGSVIAKFVYIGYYSYNALPTMYYFFLVDLGYTGVILGAMLLGVLSMFFYLKYKYSFSLKYLAVYLLFVVFIIGSTMTWMPFSAEYIISGIILYYFYKKNDKSISL